MRDRKLKCGICGKEFNCQHEFIDIAFGQKLKVPHCKKCFYDKGLCPDNHGYQCPDCQNFAPEFNIQP